MIDSFAQKLKEEEGGEHHQLLSQHSLARLSKSQQSSHFDLQFIRQCCCSNDASSKMIFRKFNFFYQMFF